MPFQIHLVSRQGFPGSLVDGYIISEPGSGMKLTRTSLTVTLIGTSTVQIPNHSTFEGVPREESKATFITIRQSPYSHLTPAPDSTFLESGDHSHFHLRFPEDPSFTNLENNIATHPRIFDPPAAQPLPPSGEFGDGNIVQYNVQASAIDQSSGKTITASIPIKFSLTREDAVINSKTVNLVRMTPLQEGLSPDRSISLSLLAPTTIAQESTFPLTVKLVESIGLPLTASTSFFSTKIYLRSASLQLLQYTTTRSTENHRHRSTKTHVLASIASIGNDIAPEILQTSTDLASVLNHPVVAKSISPSFKCANLERSYALKLQLTVQVEEREQEGGKEVDIDFEVENVRILPEEVQAMAKRKERDLFRRNQLEERGMNGL